MKTIGLVGGITWYSTLDYYRLMNEMIAERLGGVHSAKIFLSSFDFDEIKRMTEAGDWTGLAREVTAMAAKLEAAGADCILIGANTMHKIADEVQAGINIPLIHIVDVVAAALKAKGLTVAALLGTRYTMELDFYRERMAQHGIGIIIPGPSDIDFINDTIYNEFGKGIFLPERKIQYLDIIDALISKGARGVILGCTEIPILIRQDDCSVPVFDTAFLHAQAAVHFALSE